MTLASSWNKAVGHLHLSLSKPLDYCRPHGGGGWNWAVLLGYSFLKQKLRPKHLPMPAPCLCSGHKEAFPPPFPPPPPQAGKIQSLDPGQEGLHRIPSRPRTHSKTGPRRNQNQASRLQAPRLQARAPRLHIGV